MAGTKSLLQNQKFSQSINNQNLLCSCTETKTRWQHGIALFFSCLSHRIGLSLKWAISIRVWLLFQEIWLLSVFSWRIIVNRFYFDGRHLTSTMQCLQCLKACWALKKLCTMRSVSSHEGTCRCNTFLDILPQHFHVCVNVLIMSLLHVPATRPPLHVTSVCTTHVFVAATCPCKMALASGHLKSKIVQSFVHFVIYEHDWCFSSSLFARAAGECRLRTYKISLVMFLKLITFSKLMHERRRVQFKNLQNITRDVFQVLKIARAAAAVSKIRPWLIFLRKYDFSHKLGFRSPHLVNHSISFMWLKIVIEVF